MPAYPPVRYWINTVESRRCWSRLRRALIVNLLPGEGGHRIRCTPDDFMLMQIAANGNVHFKNSITRHYLVLTVADELVIPTGAPFQRGLFAHYEPEPPVPDAS